MGIRYRKYEILPREIRIWVDRDMEDGVIWSDRMFIPRDIVAIRAGEFGMDPWKDEHEIWDMILNEVHAFSEYTISKGTEFIHPLYSAFTLKEARDETLSICQGWQERHMAWHRPSSGREMIQEIHREHAVFDEEMIHLHRVKTKQLVFAEREKRMNFHVFGEESYADQMKRQLTTDIRQLNDV